MALQDNWPGEIVADDAQSFEPTQDIQHEMPGNEATPVDPVEDALENIVNEIDVPEEEAPDRSTVLAVDPGKGALATSTTVKTVKDPWLERHGPQIGQMLASGVPDADILDFMRENGAPAGYSIQEQLNWRRTPDFRAWKQQNPKSAWPIDPNVEVPLDENEKARAELAASPLGSASAGALDSLTLGFADELAGLAGADVEDFRNKQQLSAANHPGFHVAGQLAGGALQAGMIPSGVLTAAKTAAQAAYREALASGVSRVAAREAAKVAARRAVTARSAAEAGAYGATYGAGSADGDLADRAAGALSGGVAGAGLGAVMGNVGSRVANRRATPPASLTPQQEAAQAAERLGRSYADDGSPIDLLPADLGGDATRRATSMVSQTIAGGSPIKAGAERTLSQTQGVRDRIAATFGQALEPEAAGQQAIQGARSYISSSRNEARAFYSAAERATQGFKASPVKALAALDQNIAELSGTPGGAEGLKTLQAIRDDLANGKTGVSGVRAMRTALRDQFAASGLRGSDIERRVNQVVDAAADDVADSLNAAGKGDAARAFQSGDRAWRARAKTIDDVLQPLIGKDGEKSGEAVIKTLTADLQGNNARAVKFLNTLPEAERGNVVASIIGSLGRAKAGAQSADGANFSLDTFLTNWNQIGETAKRAYFGAEGRAALNDLAKIAQVSKEAGRYANRSNTGGVLGNLATLGAGTAGIPTFVATVIAQYGAGRLLASPRFARWLARAPKTTLSPPAYLDRLGRIARAEPAIANDVIALQQRLAEAFSGSAPTRLAADEAGDGSLGVPEQQGENSQDYPGEELPQ